MLTYLQWDKDMSEESMNYGDLLLGDAMDTILKSVNEQTPRVTEKVFKESVIAILKRPFHAGHLQAYLRYVKELTNPLDVVSDDNPKDVLFTVPALIQTFLPTLPGKGSPNTDSAMRAIHTEADRGIDINPMIANHLRNITKVENHSKAVLDPLREILNRYGEEIDVSDENDLVRDLPESNNATQVDQTYESSFTDEYE